MQKRESEMKLVLGIDPGPTHSAYCLTEGYAVREAEKLPNDECNTVIASHIALRNPEVCIESVQSYGKPVGREVFETCYQIGRLMEIGHSLGRDVHLYPRPEYARSLCGTGVISDAMVRQALLLRFGGDKKGEPLHLLKGESDKRSAFAVAVYHLDRNV